MLSKYRAYLYLSWPCQLRRLYRLFGHDSVTWEEAVKAVDVDKEMYLSSGRSVMHVPYGLGVRLSVVCRSMCGVYTRNHHTPLRYKLVEFSPYAPDSYIHVTP